MEMWICTIHIQQTELLPVPFELSVVTIFHQILSVLPSEKASISTSFEHCNRGFVTNEVQ